MNTVTIELCAEDRKRLDDILTALAVSVLKNKTEEPTEVEPDKNESTTPEPLKQEQPAVKRTDIQQKVIELSAAGKKAEVRDIVTTYADRVSGIPEDCLPEVWQKLAALEG